MKTTAIKKMTVDQEVVQVLEMEVVMAQAMKAALERDVALRVKLN